MGRTKRSKNIETSETTEMSENEIYESSNDSDLSDSEMSDDFDNDTDDITSAAQLYELTSYDSGLSKSDIIDTTIRLLDNISVDEYIDNIDKQTEGLSDSEKVKVESSQLVPVYDIDISSLSDEDIKAFLHLRIEVNEYLNKKNQKKIEYINYKVDEIKRIVGYTDTITTTKLNERTDKNIITEINIIPGSVELMKNIISLENKANAHIDIMFNNPKCEIVNRSLKSQNNYGLDKFNAVIRKGFYNKKSSAFAWKFITLPDSDTSIPVSYFYEPVLTDEENIQHILNNQFQIQPKAFSKPAGVIYKIYSRVPELKDLLTKFLESKNIYTDI